MGNLCGLFPYPSQYNGTLRFYDAFSRILVQIRTDLGQKALNVMHIHISGINYGPKGEKNHLPMLESDFLFKECLQALKAFNAGG